MKSTVEEIRTRFDKDVDRFSNLETGQSATVDAPLVLEMIAQAATALNPKAKTVLDVGCGAGNYTLKILERLPGLECTLLDLSAPMLARAEERVNAAGGKARTLQADIREAEFEDAGFDLILAAAVLHHLRTDEEWEAVFAKFHRILRPGGSLWISDLVTHAIPAVHEVMWSRYGDYLTGLRDESYRDHVFAYIEQEDTPRPVTRQLDLLRKVGFTEVDILHKNGPFAAFCAVKAAT